MARYEFVEGTSSKFWDIVLDGKSFTTTYGKIGTAGQSTTKSFGSDAEAKKEHDKLVAEKTKKGYAAAGGGGGGAKKPVAPKEEEDDDNDDVDDEDDEHDDEPAPKPAATAAAGARHFEFAEGTSSKFWEVSIVGSEVRTRYGKIGAAGQTTLKDLGSPAAALKEHAKLIAEKLKKGYEESGGGGGGGDDSGGVGGGKGGALDKRNPELEKVIAADPYDDDGYQIYADWLQGQGDLRGELIALQIAGKKAPADRVLAANKAYFYGALADHQTTYDGHDEDAFTWKNGFIHTARLSHNSYAAEDFEGSIAEILGALLAHPSGRFLAELTLVFNGDPNEATLDDLFALLAAQPLPALRKLHIGDFEIRGEDTEISWYNVGDASKIWAAMPGLKTLILQGGSFTLGALELPALTHAEFKTGGLAKASAASIAAAKWPKLQHLDVWFGDDNYGGDCDVTDVAPLIARTDLRALRHLGLMNSAFTDDLAAALPAAAILPQLSELSLAMGTLTDDGAQAIGAHKDAFEHLAILDVSDNYLTDAGIKALKGCAKKVQSGEQRDDDGPEDRYPSVGE